MTQLMAADVDQCGHPTGFARRRAESRNENGVQIHEWCDVCGSTILDLHLNTPKSESA
jgi:hypothetical protein